jgi:chromosome segregation ATPase
LLSIHSIEFVNSLCIVKKRRPDENVLGRRIVVGSEELVTIGLAKLDGTHIQDFSMAIKDDSDLNVSNLVKNLEATNHSVEILTVDLGKKEQLISDLGKGLEDEKRVTEMLSANLTERDQELVKLTTDLAMRDQTQETLTTSLAERDQTLENLQIALTESQKEVVEYTQSNSWRITRPLRKISKYLQGNNDEPDTTAL